MQSEALLEIFYIVGWGGILPILAVAILALSSKLVWRYPYALLGTYLCIIAVLEVAMAVLDIISENNFHINFLYIILEFPLIILYLSSVFESRAVKQLTWTLIVAFLLFQLYRSIDDNAHGYLDPIGVVINTSIIILYALGALSWLFRKNPAVALRKTADFWFAATIFCLNVIDLIIFIMINVTYDAMSEDVYLMLQITRNLLKAVLFYGYWRGIKLVRQDLHVI